MILWLSVQTYCTLWKLYLDIGLICIIIFLLDYYFTILTFANISMLTILFVDILSVVFSEIFIRIVSKINFFKYIFICVQSLQYKKKLIDSFWNKYSVLDKLNIIFKLYNLLSQIKYKVWPFFVIYQDYLYKISIISCEFCIRLIILLR